MSLCGQKSSQVFVEHVRCIYPISTETETVWSLKKNKIVSIRFREVDECNFTLRAQLCLTTFHLKVNTKPVCETIAFNFVSFNGRWEKFRTLMGLKVHKELLNDYRIVTFLRTDGRTDGLTARDRIYGRCSSM
jgi:hypothetical protein